MDMLPEASRIGVRHSIRGCASTYCINFPTAEAAADAYKIWRGRDLEWKDEFHGVLKQIKVFRDQKIEDRNASRMIGKLWQPVLDDISKSGRWNDALGMRLMNNRRRLWVTYKDEPFVLFTVEVKDKDTYVIKPDFDNCKWFGIDKEAAEGHAVQARASLARA
jgi:hypothetical protein